MMQTTLTLVQAIREGALKRPQAFGEFFLWDLKYQHYGSSALGAAYEAAGGEPTTPPMPRGGSGSVYGSPWRRIYAKTYEIFPILHMEISTCPICQEPLPSNADLFWLIEDNLNCHHRLSREEIADIVEKIIEVNSSATRESNQESISSLK